MKDPLLKHTPVIDKLIGLLKDLHWASKLPGAELEMHHTYQSYAQQIHKMYVDKFDELMRNG